MTCKKCGKENANDSHYCIQCGAPLFENSDINTAGAGNQPVAQNEAVAQNMNSVPNRTVEPEAKKTGRHSAGRGIIIAAVWCWRWCLLVLRRLYLSEARITKPVTMKILKQ